jgi:hypothetical protein
MNQDQESAIRSWKTLLNPDELRANLVLAAVYLTGYEMLRDALIDHLEGFFSKGFDANGLIIGDSYRQKVLNLHKMPFFASAEWFCQAGAIDRSDVDLIKRIREHRNFIAHHIPEIICGTREVDAQLLLGMRKVTAKIDGWWLREVEIPTDPDFDDKDMTEANLDASFSLRGFTMDLLVQLATGNEEPLREIYSEFVKQANEVFPQGAG